MSYFKHKEILLIVLFAAGFTALSVLIVERLLATARQLQAEDQRKTITLQVLTAKNALENAIILDTYVGSSVATLATVAPDVLEQNWQSIANQFMKTATAARSVALLPNDVIGYIYPLKGNEQALGLDLRNYPGQYKAIEQAKRLQRVVIAGPLELVQGGSGIVIRYPVFRDFPDNNQYWGSISVVIDFQSLLEESGLTRIDTAQIAIRGQDATGANGPVFWGDPTVFAATDIEFPIALPSGSWFIGATFNSSQFTADPQTSIIRAAMYLVCLVMFGGLLVFYQAYKRTNKDAFHDELTGLANRRLIMKKLNELAELPHNKASYALLNIDLNDFKQVNDNFGHSAGDSLLQFVAGGLKSKFRSSDLVARMGGDEFMVILYRIDSLQHALSHVEKLHHYFATHSLTWNDAELSASLSIGVAHSHEVDGNVEALLMLADKRMYKQKQ